MIYRPKQDSLWDTWVFYDKETYYLYYLYMGPTERQGWHGQGVALATSKDGVHWAEIGHVLPKDETATGLGDGPIWKVEGAPAGGRFIMNYSTWFDWCIQSQSIRFAESADLVHWTKLGPSYEFSADPRWYESFPQHQEARWDGLWPIVRQAGGFYGYWTARPLGRPGFGFGESLDGVVWSALEPPIVEGAEQGEVGAVEWIEDRVYMMYHGGRTTLVADRPQGPFRPAPKNRGLLVGDAYFARFLTTPHGILVNHHSIPRDGFRASPDAEFELRANHGWAVRQGACYLAPLKRAIVDGEGTLRLGYWEGNEKLKGRSLEMSSSALRPAGEPSFCLFECFFDPDTGVILEGTLPLTSQLGNAPGPWYSRVSWPARSRLSGLYVECQEGPGCYIAVARNGVTEIGLISSDGSAQRQEWLIDRDLVLAGQARFRLLLRGSLLEFYLEDILIQVYSLPRRAAGRIGVLPGVNTASVRGWRAWEMNLTFRSA